MPKVSIRPHAVLLTSGQAATFEAVDDAGNPIQVTWSLNPSDGGSLATPGSNNQGASATYVAPLVPTARTIALIAIGNNDSASATVSLTPDAISIVPASVDLKSGQVQQFKAIVAGAPMLAAAPMPAAAPAQAGTPLGDVTWILSPPSGTLTQDGLYRAPADAPDSITVNVTATSEASGKQGKAVINLSSPPWTGRGVQFLGAYLFLVFTLVFLIVLLWPPALPSPESARANRIEAEKTWEEKTTALAQTEPAKLKAYAKFEIKSHERDQARTSPGSKPAEDQTTFEEAQADKDAAYYANERAEQARNFAEKDLEKKREIEDKVNDPNVATRLVGKINRELDLLWLVLLAGCLGAFLHMAQSFSDFMGNRTIKSSWAWWYYFRPFIGAGLALVFYAALRGGVISIATGSNAKASELNPFGLVGVAAMVGMFSRAATMKLGEVFDTLFKSAKAGEAKDKLVSSSQTANQPAAGTAGTTASSTTK